MVNEYYVKAQKKNTKTLDTNKATEQEKRINSPTIGDDNNGLSRGVFSL
jgi:hypothetical protein